VSNEDIEKLLETIVPTGEPRADLRARVLQESLSALARGRRNRARWRVVSLSAAAVLIAGTSFLLGRASLSPGEARPAPPAPSPVAAGNRTTTVPNDVVAWLDAARLFRQLGMEDRMARAVDRASQLLPRDTILAEGTTAIALDPEGDARVEEQGGLPGSMESLSRIMAQSLEIER
jgi:hypothetical protein